MHLLTIMLEIRHPRVLVLTEHLNVVLDRTGSFLMYALLRVVATSANLTRAQPVWTATDVTLFVRPLLRPSILVQLAFHGEDS